MGELLEKRFFFGHSHAAGDADDLPFFFGAGELSDFTHHLSFGKVSYGAGVKDEEIALFLVVNSFDAPLFQCSDHDLGIEFVHLAPVGANKKSFWLFHFS